MHDKTGLAACFFLLLFGGCSSSSKPTPQNFTNALNAWYAEHNECLFPQGRQFPYEVSPGPQEKVQKAQMDALTGAGLLQRLEDRSIHVESYSLTPAGQRFAPRFCYGHREVTSINSFTPPAPRNGFTETAVTFRYTMMDVPLWAKTDAIEAAFPEVGQSLSPTATAQATLATVGAGWHMPE